MFDRLGCLAAAKKEGECLAETQSAKGTKRRKGTWRGRIESGRNVEDGRLASHSSPQRCRSVPTATTCFSTVHLHEKFSITRRELSRGHPAYRRLINSPPVFGPLYLDEPLELRSIGLVFVSVSDSWLTFGVGSPDPCKPDPWSAMSSTSIPTRERKATASSHASPTRTSIFLSLGKTASDSSRAVSGSRYKK